MKKKQSLIIILISVFFMYGCYPDSSRAVDDYTIVHTAYNVEYDFSNKVRIYMPDTIAFSTNADDVDMEDFTKWEDYILQQVSNNFEAQGYEMIDSTEAGINPPDMVALVAGIAAVQAGVIWWPGPGYWWGWYPYNWEWDASWAWYYPPGWGGYWSYYAYTTGTISIFMGDYELAGNDIENGVELEWNANINGLLSGVVDEQKIETNVEQAFAQSPYISINE